MKDKLKYVGDPKAQPVDGLDKVLGHAKYVGDMSLAGMLHAKILTSPVPHANILRIDTSPALKIPGVVAVITSDDFVENGPLGFPIKDAFVLAHKKVRYVGDPIATVAAETIEAAEAGAKAIILELEELPVITDPAQALEDDAPLIPLEAPQKKGNLCDLLIVRNGDPDPILVESEQTLNQSYYFQHQEHAYLETEGALAIPEPGGGVTVFANDQSPHINRFNTASVLGLPPEQVRIIQPPVGGSFGGKDDIGYQLTAQVARLALNTNRPVRLILSREESILISYKRAAMTVQLNIGMDADGKLRAGKAKMDMDSGAYASMSPLAAWRATMHALGTYKYEAGHVDTQVIYTNNGYSGAFRGFGSPQAAAASEIAIDELSDLAKTDPIEFRLKNIIRKGDIAFTGNKITYESGLEECLEWVRDASDWKQKRVAYPKTADAETLRGVGVACYFHGSGLGGEGLDYARTTIKIEKDHSITLQSGMTDY
ncbi:MAG: xanthine dehydrogenase family protein, partial [Anaerolineae bacterium]|nr:xanthine dehydrogenase family protein [Anaerolineae bacterium]